MDEGAGLAGQRVEAGRAGALLWLLCFQFFVAEQVVRLGWRTPYSFAGNYISDLGAVRCGIHDASRFVCSPWHAGMNFSFVLQGFLIAIGAVLVRRMLVPGWLAAVGVVAIAVGGLGVLIVGLFPEDVNLGAHIVGAQAHFLGGNVGMLLVGLAMLRWREASRVVAGWTLLAGAVGMAGTLLFVHGYFLGLGVGGMERVAVYPLPVWLPGMGIWLLKRRAHPI